MMRFRPLRKPKSKFISDSKSQPNLAQHTVQFSRSNFVTTHLLSSSKEPKPICKIMSFASLSSLSSLKSHLNHEPINTLLFNSSKESSFMFKTKCFDPFLYKFVPTRSFSDKISDSSPSFESSKPIDAGSSMRKPLSLWPGMYHSPVTNALWEARSRMFEKTGDKPIDSIAQSELAAKPPSKSRTSILYKFSSDYILKEQYRNPWNEMRMGKLLEDLDALAGTISYKMTTSGVCNSFVCANQHCCNDDGATRPILLVTASVDRMVVKKPIRVDIDLELTGAVTWVGRSSMEIQLEVTQSTQDTTDSTESVALVANFTFVARDTKTGKSAPINQILPETEKEKLLWEEAEQRNKMRKTKRAERKMTAENGDKDRLNALLAEGRIFCDMPALADRDSILIKDTCHENSLMCQPQQRNIHGRIFGGFLMRKASELAFSTAYTFAGAAPLFVEVDHVDFLKPVDVGNFLRLKSCVLYTELENPARPLINVEVVAHVTSPELRASEISNKFYFTFTIRPEVKKDGLSIRNVVPATEEEARRVLERMDAENSQLAQT
ncbi:thioesterase [Citrus sinensis]|uniref:Thioesterase n=1 Tax=Citrus sinensis TaxID=2711 RepID=A0ACB8MBJ1_CITSI|nr:thioesterase [Citrus sinensis]